ncbi:DUF4440 domain-containing protein [Mesorhizobium sp. ISC25]|uniref:YybH family protein n=1 Tax=Mesorhizobium sp. ISC25 TaxID=3077335 RepID=UPI0035DE4C7B
MRLVQSFAFAAVLLFSSALSVAAQSARQDIEAALTKFTDAYNSGNTKAVGQMYTDDAALLPPDGKRVDGRKGVEEFWQGAIKAGMKNLTLKALEVEGSGNLAYEVGAFTLGVPSKGGALSTMAGKYIVVWKKATTGRGACIGTSGI